MRGECCPTQHSPPQKLCSQSSTVITQTWAAVTTNRTYGIDHLDLSYLSGPPATGSALVDPGQSTLASGDIFWSPMPLPATHTLVDPGQSTPASGKSSGPQCHCQLHILTQPGPQPTDNIHIQACQPHQSQHRQSGHLDLRATHELQSQSQYIIASWGIST